LNIRTCGICFTWTPV